MSWDGYTSQLVQSGFQHAAVCGLDGSIWAKSPGLEITADEIKTIIGAFSNNSQLISSGVHVGGTKYFFLQSDTAQIQGKKGTCGVSISKANTCLIIGVYPDGLAPGAARDLVEKMTGYLKSSNY